MMARILVVPVGRGASLRAGVPDELAGRTRVFLVVKAEGEVEGMEGASEGDVVLLGEGQEYGMRRVGKVCELRSGGQGAEVTGNVVGVLKKFNR
jgi:hypothetical protein